MLNCSVISSYLTWESEMSWVSTTKKVIPVLSRKAPASTGFLSEENSYCWLLSPAPPLFLTWNVLINLPIHKCGLSPSESIIFGLKYFYNLPRLSGSNCTELGISPDHLISLCPAIPIHTPFALVHGSWCLSENKPTFSWKWCYR